MAKKLDRTGETSFSNFDNMKMEIIAYRNARDIDIRFEDGAEVYHKAYDPFIKGKIKYPITALIGKTKRMKNGYDCTIINVRGYTDIDVVFSNGVENKHQNMTNWRSGSIGFPLDYKKKLSQELALSRVGLTRRMHNGIEATIIAYKDDDDIDIQFETGEVKKGVRYTNFMLGHVATKERFNKVGQISIMSNGMKATITKYRNYQDIDIQFEDGKKREHVRYKEFMHGRIAYDPRDELSISKIGETVVHKKSGMLLSLICYRNATDIDIEFEDGAIVKHKTYSCFKKGLVQYPIPNYIPVEKREGTQLIMNNGLEAECVSYSSTHDINVKFLVDGAIVEHKAWHDFVTGFIAHPTIKPFSSMLEKNVEKYLLENRFDYSTQVIYKKEKLTGIGGGYLSYDFAINDKNQRTVILIECQGQQHFFPIDLFGGESQFEIQQAHDELKREFARDHSIELIEVPYTEDNYEKVSCFLDKRISK